MNKIAIVFVTATLLLNAMAPTLAYSATYLQGTQVNADTLKQDAYVAVTYYDSKNKQTLYKGWIDAVEETAFQIRSRALFRKKTIAYNKVLSVIMSERETTRSKQINEVERFIREMKKQEVRALDTEQVALQRLNQKTVKVMPRGQIDTSQISWNWYAYTVYTSKENATGRIVSKTANSIITIQNNQQDKKIAYKKIAYDNIDTLIVAKHLRDIERYRETDVKYNARVRVLAPSIQKGQMVGTLIKMMQDTLVIESRRNFYQVPVSSISKFDVSTKQYRNTGKGFKIGLAAGAGIAVLIKTQVSGEGFEGDGWEEFTEFFMILISLPSIIGISTLIGAMKKSDKWVEVPPQRFNLSLSPTKEFRVALTFNF